MLKSYRVPALARLTLTIGSLITLLSGFSGCYVGYSKADGKVAYHSWNEGTGKNVDFLEGADPITFIVLHRQSYAKDSRHVWFITLPIAGADPGTFEVLSDPFYGKDKNHVYMQQDVIPDADPATFKLLSSPWARDESHVYCEKRSVKVHSINTFEVVLACSIIGGWARDGVAYYYGTKEVVDADYNSFTVLSDAYAKDKYKVYHHGNPVPLADPVTFEVLNEHWAKDKNHRYYLGSIAN